MEGKRVRLVQTMFTEIKAVDQFDHVKICYRSTLKTVCCVYEKKLMVYTNTSIYLGLSEVLMDYPGVCRQHLIIHNNITLEKTPNSYGVGQAAPLKVAGTRYKVQRWAA